MRIGTPMFKRYFELNAKNPQQKNAPIVYGSQMELEPVLFLLLSIVSMAENTTIIAIAITDLSVSGAEKMNMEAIAVKTT